MTRTLLTLLLFLPFLFENVLSAQTSTLIIGSNVRLPRDSVVRNRLTSSLTQFLKEVDGPNSKNKFIQVEDLLETSALLDEMKDLGFNRALKAVDYYKPYLTNVSLLKKDEYLIQISYLGVDRDTPHLRASFSFFAIDRNGQFYFLSPIKEQTRLWKYAVFGETKVYFKDSINKANASLYFSRILSFDSTIDAKILPCRFYSASNFPEVLRLLGIDYKQDYNGVTRNSEYATENERRLAVNGSIGSDFDNYDPHDLWHSRLHQAFNVDTINRPVDEGTAYLYGGSWGYSWEEILKRFKNYAKANPAADWLALYNQSFNFDSGAKFPLNVDFVINALIAKKIVQQRGFAGVVPLLCCGKKQSDNANYFKVLEKLTGIRKSTFNKEVGKMIGEK